MALALPHRLGRFRSWPPSLGPPPGLLGSPHLSHPKCCLWSGAPPFKSGSLPFVKWIFRPMIVSLKWIVALKYSKVDRYSKVARAPKWCPSRNGFPCPSSNVQSGSLFQSCYQDMHCLSTMQSIKLEFIWLAMEYLDPRICFHFLFFIAKILVSKTLWWNLLLHGICVMFLVRLSTPSMYLQYKVWDDLLENIRRYLKLNL